MVNPNATTTSRRTREVLAAALEHELKLEVARTDRRGHATELASQALVDGVDLVVVLGGDGTVNEVVNGLLADGPHADLPDLAVVPGGGTNVFARALGIPEDPVEATGVLLEALQAGDRRTIGLGRADDRWFTFCAGLGLDAEVVASIDRRRHAGAPAAWHYVAHAVRAFYLGADRRHPALTVDAPGVPVTPGVFLAIVANTSPWTYLGNRPLQPCPDATFESGLDLYAVRRLRTAAGLRQVRQLLGKPRPGGPRGRQVLTGHDLAHLTISADRPVAFQVDGEPLGERSQVTFTAHPQALRVVCQKTPEIPADQRPNG